MIAVPHPDRTTMNETLRPRVAIVTGAGSGIGQAVAITLHRAGYAVALAGRRLERLEATIAAAMRRDLADETQHAVDEAWRGTPAPLAEQASDADADPRMRERLLAHAVDVADPTQVRDLFDAVVDRYGRVDVVFNNAGSGAPAVPIDELEFAAWRKVVDANLTGTFLCIQHAFRVMKAQTPRGGRIINNGSISAYAPRPNSAPYTATKHGVTGLTKCAALDGRGHDIAVGQIDIGNAATDMTARMRTGIAQANGQVAVEPTMDVRHVADAVLHMASLPLDANVLFMTVMATEMPYVGRG
jgi:NAD(P)-dependent dehydrogenase (short-subunit alcohol dehydrogenase family)